MCLRTLEQGMREGEWQHRLGSALGDEMDFRLCVEDCPPHSLEGNQDTACNISRVHRFFFFFTIVRYNA